MASAAWTVSMRFSVNLLGMISSIVLARLLTPTDFGLVGLAGSVYVFLRMIGQFGFDAALIQMPKPGPEHYNTAWTANILVGVIVCVLTIAVAKPAALFYGDARIEQIVYVFAAFSLLNCFQNIGIVNFRKNLAFRGDFLYFVLPKIIMLCAALPAAYYLRNYWALVIGMFASQVAALVYSYVAQSYRPWFSLAKLGELFNFSKWVLLNNLQGYMSHNGVEVILGRLRDAGTVGVFNLARQIATMPTSEIVSPLNRALFPSFSAISDDTARVRAVLGKVVGMAFFVALPAASGIVALADELVVVLLGDNWLPAIPILAVLSFAGAVHAIRGQFAPILLARGKPKIISRNLVVYTGTIVGGTLAVAGPYGGLGIAYVTLAAEILMMPLMTYAVRREIGFPVTSLLEAMWRPALACVAMVALVRYAAGVLEAAGPLGIGGLAALIAIGAAGYACAVVSLWLVAGRPAGTERELLHMAGAAFHRLRGATA